MNLLKEVVPSSRSWRSVNWRQELFAAFIGVVLVIPQAIAFSHLASVPIEVGMVCAVYVTLLSALFGNSIMMSGPNTATSILMGSTVASWVEAGWGDPTSCVLVLSLMVGLIQLVIWILRGAKIFDQLQPATISGITIGVGLLIMKSALLELFHSTDRLFGFFTLAAGGIFLYLFRRHYLSLTLLAGTLIAILSFQLGWMSEPVESLQKLSIDFFSFRLPEVSLVLRWPQAAGAWMSAAAVAVVSLMHSLVIARDLKHRKDPQIDLHKEVFAIGLANVLASGFGGFAGSGSFNRTQANEESLARTPVAAVLTATFVAMLVTFAGWIFGYLPLVVISSILFIVGFKMINFKTIGRIFSSRETVLPFVSVLLVFLFFDIAAAVVLAIIWSWWAARSGPK